MNLILAILLTSLLFLIFRVFPQFKVKTFNAIVINYITCGITGLLINANHLNTDVFVDTGVLSFGIGIGLFFIVTFFLMALTTQEAGITTSAIAGKISMIIPVLYALVYLGKNEGFTTYNYLGIVLAFAAIVFSSIKNKSQKNTSNSMRILLMVLFVFVFSGVIDTLLNYVNNRFTIDGFQGQFPIICFGSAASFGSILLVYQLITKKNSISKRDLIAGGALGIPNYFSIFFVLKALSDYDNNGAFLFPVSNIGVILVSAMVGIIYFKDKLSILNWLGLICSVLAIFLLSYQVFLN